MNASASQMVEVILRRLLEGSVDPVVAIERLSPYATIEVDANPSFVNWTHVVAAEVPLRATDVRRGVEHYLSGEWDQTRLRRWATLLTFFDHYRAPEPPADDEDFNDDLWDVIHELSSPEVFGAITRASVDEKIERLRKYSH